MIGGRLAKTNRIDALSYIVCQSHHDQAATEVGTAATEDEALTLARASAAKAGLSAWIICPDRSTIRVYAEGDTAR